MSEWMNEWENGWMEWIYEWIKYTGDNEWNGIIMNNGMSMSWKVIGSYICYCSHFTWKF